MIVHEIKTELVEAVIYLNEDVYDEDSVIDMLAVLYSNAVKIALMSRYLEVEFDVTLDVGNSEILFTCVFMDKKIVAMETEDIDSVQRVFQVIHELHFLQPDRN